jgi:hypothetical protein
MEGLPAKFQLPVTRAVLGYIGVVLSDDIQNCPVCNMPLNGILGFGDATPTYPNHHEKVYSLVR